VMGVDSKWGRLPNSLISSTLLERNSQTRQPSRNRPLRIDPMIHNWMRMLLAVLLGNLIYFAVEQYLPEVLSHDLFRVDAGLVVDLGICASIYVLLRKK